MAYIASVLEIFIASPSDVAAERQIVRDVVREWNNMYARDRKTVLLATGWETHSSPSLDGRPQQLINDRLLRYGDILVGIFWTRLGSSTGKAASGTTEEIDEHRKAGKPVMLYFSEAPVPMKQVDADQYKMLIEFKEWALKQGLVEEFATHEEFREKFRRQLPGQLQENPYIRSLLSDKGCEDVSLPQMPSIALSADAGEILAAAAALPEGMIIISHLLGATRIIVGSKEFGDGGQRSAARWEAAVAELVNSQFLKPRSNPDVLYLTENAYQYLEKS